jgi:hypothetical protein
MPRAGNFIVLALVVVVALSPLCEILDKTDEWSHDCSDFVLYITCLFCFLGFALLRRSGVIIARLASSRIAALSTVQRPLILRRQQHAASEERELFLTFCDLRI